MSESELIAHKKGMEVAFERNRTPHLVRDRARVRVRVRVGVRVRVRVRVRVGVSKKGMEVTFEQNRTVTRHLVVTP